MNQFEMLKKRARQTPFAAQNLDSVQCKMGIKIFKMRLQRGLTQKQLAELANTTQKTISRIEAGDPGIEMSTYEKVFQLLKE